MKTERSRILGAALMFAAGLVLAGPRAAEAATLVYSVGGPGLDQGQLCPSTLLCPGNPAYSWQSGGQVSGTITYDSTAGTASFSFLLTQNASFGGETLLSGSTFSGSNIPVALSALGAGQQITQTGALVSGSANLLFSPSLSMQQNSPVISAFSCTLFPGNNLCGVSLGSTGLVSGPDGSGNSYSAFLTFNVTAAPVPLPAGFGLLGSGLAGLLGLARSRRLRRA
jgi:hypothetical protein